MALTLKQSRSIQQIARVLYDFLPGSGSVTWKNHVSFQSIARDLKLVNNWPGGNKARAIEDLLRSTLENNSMAFEPLIERVVRESLTYRERQGNPLKRADVECLNGLILELGFKFPNLWDEDFLDSLTGDSLDRATRLARSSSTIARDDSATTGRMAALMSMRDDFFALCSISDRQAAGFALEKLLNSLFEHFGLEPRSSFRVIGEQIDGSFVLDFETYLAEAKWTAAPTSAADLFAFRGKVEGKSSATRGLFLSINGFTSDGTDALLRGKQPLFFLMDGSDLLAVLQDQIELPQLLRLKQRRLAEEGRLLLGARELLPVL